MENSLARYRESVNPRWYLEVKLEPSKRRPGAAWIYVTSSRGWAGGTLNPKQLRQLAGQLIDFAKRLEEMPGLRPRRVRHSEIPAAPPGPQAPRMDGSAGETHTVTLRKKDGTEETVTYRADGWAVGEAPGPGEA
jgi:hypothetical protein